MRQLNASERRLSALAPALLLAGMLGLAWTPSTAEAREVRVATFNIENGTRDPESDKHNVIHAKLEPISWSIPTPMPA